MKIRHLLLAFAVAGVPGALADFHAPPSPPVFSQVPPAATGRAAPASGGDRYLIGDPTDEEQMYLELVNRTRADPKAEGERLAATKDPDIVETYGFFGVDLAKLRTDLAALVPAQPLAFEPRLSEMARGHTAWMFNNALQAHEETDPAGSTNIVNTTGDRFQRSGYPAAAGGESVFAYARSAEYGHAGFEVDWGFGPGGVQVGVGHRVSNHNPVFREVGIGVIDGSRTVIRPGETNTVGPQVVTLDFGSRFDLPPLVTGVAYYDLNGNQFYDIGEGVGGITVEVSDGNSFAVTTASGGYAVPSQDGPHLVRFSGTGFSPAPKEVTVVGGANVKMDLRMTYVPPVVAGPSSAFLGGPNTYAATFVPGATAYVWEYARRVPLTVVFGAESGAGDFVASVTPGYLVVSKESRATGLASYHLATQTSEPESLTFVPRIRSTPGGTLSFATRLGAATTNQFASVQVSTNYGTSWVTVWEQFGRVVNNGGTIEDRFTARSVALAPFAGQEMSVRFVYSVVKGNGVTYFPGTNFTSGFYFDDVRFTGVEQLTDIKASTVPEPVFELTPPVAGDFALRVAPKVGAHAYTAGPWILATTTNVPPVAVTAGPSAVVLGPSGNLRLDFQVTGVPVVVGLERSVSPTGPWAAVAATLATNSPGKFSFKQIPVSDPAGYLRVSVR